MGPKDWSPGRPRITEGLETRWLDLERLTSLSAVREAVKEIPRMTLVAMLQWNDPNGVYLDAMARAEGFEPLTKGEAEGYIVSVIEESAWPEDDPRRGL